MIFNLGLLIVYVVVAAGLSVVADGRLKEHPRLPMQWGFDGRPTWFASRRVALAITPLLSGIGFMVVTVIRLTAPEPEAADAARLTELQFGLGALGLGVQAVYLWMARRWARQAPSG